MSCRFLFFLLLIIIQKSFSSIHISPNRNQLQYSFKQTNPNQINQRIKRRTTSDTFQIHIHYDISVKKYKYNFTLKNFYKFVIDY